MIYNSNKKNKRLFYFFIFLIAVIFLSFDRFLKVLAINNFFNDRLYKITDFFKLNFAKNYNIAFSFPFSGYLLSIAIIFIIIGLIYSLIFFIKKQKIKISACLIFIIFGAISNLYDRIKGGYVIDYFDLKYFTIFNLADVMIVFGVLGIIFLEYFKKTKK